MICPKCQSDNPDSGRFCDECGTSLATVCGACGAATRPGAKFCGQCGARADGGPKPEALAPEDEPTTRLRIATDAGERKQVTVLFADIRGSTEMIDALDPEQAMLLLDPAVGKMVEAVQRYGGTVNRVQGDGIMALFGAPVATEDHAARACLAAQAILADVASLHDKIAVRVGMNSGEVVIRAVGNDPSDYDAVGVVAHIAHRLEQLAAPNSACLPARTAMLAHGTVDLEMLGSHHIAGIAERMELFRLISAHERPSWEIRASAGRMTPLVGREAELRQLEQALGQAALGRSQVICVIGEAGIGKSRLMHEFLKRLPSGYWNVVSAAAVSHGIGAPYRLAADILRAVLGVDRQHGRAEVARKLAQTLALLGIDSPEESAPLESLLDLPVTDEDWNELSPDARRERMLPVLRAIIPREAAIRPLLLVVEDLHWVDPQTESMIGTLLDSLNFDRVLVLLSGRPAPAMDWGRLAGRGNASRIALTTLDRDGSHQLLRNLLGDSQELETLRERIVAQSDGTPLFIEEMARVLLDQGVLVAHAPMVKLNQDIGELQLPASVQAVVAARIDQLAPDIRRTLSIAAVIGRDVQHDVLRLLAGIGDAELEAHLSALKQADLLLEVTAGAGREHIFKHIVIHTVAYESMLRRSRREFHARALTALEDRAADRQDEELEHLADHAVRGEVWERAVALCTRAGTRANVRSAWTAAVGFFDKALAALAKLPETPDNLRRAIDVRLALRVALGPLTEINRVLAVLEEAVELAVRLGDPTRVAQIDVSRCVFLTIFGRLDQAIAAGERGRREARQLTEPMHLLNAAYALAQAHWFAGNFGTAEQVLEENIHLLRGPMRLHSAGTSGSISVLSLVCLSKTYAITGAFDRALQLSIEAQEIARETAKPYDLTYAQVARGFAHLMAGQAMEAVEELMSALEHCRQGNVPLLIPSVARYLGRAYAMVGRTDDAHDLLEETLETCHAQNMVALTIWCGLASGHAHIEGGTHDDAATRLGHSLMLAQNHAYRPAEAHAWHLLGRSRLAQGKREAALQALAAGEALARELGMKPELDAIAETRRLYGVIEAAHPQE
jgi:class 3 adenylate cyclase/tetratricopeptide (TPR) repeat protein